MSTIARIIRPGLFSLSLMLLAAVPAHAGVIQIDFTASVINGGGPLGAQGDEFTGLIRFELIDFIDRNPSPSVGTFASGPLLLAESTLAEALTFDLFPVGGTPSFESDESAVLFVENSPEGDRLNVFVRSTLPSGDIFDELSLVVDGSSDLFAGDFGLEENLPGIEALLLSFDFDEANPGIFLTSEVTANIGPGLPNLSNIGRPGVGEETVLLITSASITRVAPDATDLPEPGQLGMLALGLLLVRNRAIFKT